MADYVIGDLQGCFKEFKALLNVVNFNPSRDHLYLVGDVIARGPESLACLHYLYQLQGSVSISLGNHDLHLLATYFSQSLPNPKDNLSELFASDKLPSYVEFLQHQPLAIWLEQHNTLISHAGLNPQLSLKKALLFAQHAAKLYRSYEAKFYLTNMYGNAVNALHRIDSELSQFSFTVNSFTRMRFIDAHGNMDFQHKNEEAPSGSELIPWFALNPSNHQMFKICFGHWAALKGKTPFSNLFALDTGCVWGNHMTLLELSNGKQHYFKASN